MATFQFKFGYCVHRGHPNHFNHEIAIRLFYLYIELIVHEKQTYMHAYG